MQSMMNSICLVGDASVMSEWATMLEEQGHHIRIVQGLREVSNKLHRRPALLIRADASTGSNDVPPGDVAEAAHRLGIPLLDIVEDGSEPGALVDRHGEADDWVFRSRAAVELPARVAHLLRRGRRKAGLPRGQQAAPIDSKFLALAVHDLRTPLNVVGLSLRMIDQAIPRGDPELLEDLKFVEENFRQIERMLSELSDYCRLYESESPLTVTEFSPARMMGELVEDRSTKASAGTPPIRLHVEESCPAEASLDPGRARMAIQYVLSNAAASTQDVPIEITLRGGPDRLITEVRVDRPPPSSVKSVALRPDTFERLFGSAAERRGLDLAIAARVSEMFGGTARLDAVEDRGTTIVMDWPARLPMP